MSSPSSSKAQMPPNPEQFKAMQKVGWSNVAQGWKKWWSTFEDGAQKLSDRLVELAEINPGDKVLDIATGIGEPAITAAKKVKPNGQVIAMDISAGMLAIARERARDLKLDGIMAFEESDAETYAYPNSSFDVVLSRWGLMFFPDIAATLKRIHNSLAANGVLSVAVWSTSDKTPMLTIPLTVASRAVGIPAPLAAGSLGPFRFADPALLENSLAEAGFHNIKTEKMSLPFRFASVDDFINFQKSVNSPILAMIGNLPEQKQEETWRAMAEAMRQHTENSGALKMDNEVIIAVARL
jgi:ubiquinone/menaquinone biosynthesis C-methylase UbiE